MRAREIRNRIRTALFAAAAVMLAATAAVSTLVLVASQSQAQETERAKQLGQKLMCICGCNQILGSCNHIGCSYSHGMLKELDDFVARNEPDDLTLQAFVQEYGPNVLAEPPAKGFNRAAWIMPVAVPLISLYLLWEVMRRWRHKAALVSAAGPKVSPQMLERARRESEREADD
jgi:cytochrome c-type biogenesis protein CcmH